MWSVANSLLAWQWRIQDLVNSFPLTAWKWETLDLGICNFTVPQTIESPNQLCTMTNMSHFIHSKHIFLQTKSTWINSFPLVSFTDMSMVSFQRSSNSPPDFGPLPPSTLQKGFNYQRNVYSLGPPLKLLITLNQVNRLMTQVDPVWSSRTASYCALITLIALILSCTVIPSIIYITLRKKPLRNKPQGLFALCSGLFFFFFLLVETILVCWSRAIQFAHVGSTFDTRIKLILIILQKSDISTNVRFCLFDLFHQKIATVMCFHLADK